jgi:hypothetical protein
MGLMDDIMADGAFNDFFSVKPGDPRKKIRFLTDGNDGIQANVHTYWMSDDPEKPRGGGHWEYKVLCKKQLGKPCPFCEREAEEGVKRIERHYGWMIYNHTDSRVQILLYKKNKTTPIDQITEQWAIRETLVDRDYFISVKSSSRDDQMNRTTWTWNFSGDDKDEPDKRFKRSSYGINLPEKDGKLDLEKIHEDMLRKVSGMFNVEAPIQPQKKVAQNGTSKATEESEELEPVAAAAPKAARKNAVKPTPKQSYDLNSLNKDLGIEMDDDSAEVTEEE